YDTDAYGNTFVFDGPGTASIWFSDGDHLTNFSANQYIFTGRQCDQETGLYDYRARSYSPALGRFAGRDPIGYVPIQYSYVISHVRRNRAIRSGDMNLFARKNVLETVDPQGLRECKVSAFTVNPPVGRRKTESMTGIPLPVLGKIHTSIDYPFTETADFDRVC